MKTFIGLSLTACAVAGASVTPVVGGTGFTGAIELDFEGFAEGTSFSTQYAGVTFSQTGGGTPLIDNEPFLFGYTATSGVGVLTGSAENQPFPTVAGLIATFDAGQSRVGAWMTDTVPLGDYTAWAFDANGDLLATVTISPAIFDANGGAVFVGFESTTANIVSVQWGPNVGGESAGDAFAIDDLQYIPAPGVVGLAGVAAVAGLRRRR